MTLPTMNIPTYELEVPSTKEKLAYRPFLVKEEKILLMAMEEEKESQLNRALKQVVNNCTFEKIKVDKLPLFDLEYIFLRIRAKSIGEVTKLKLLCEDDGETYADVEINIDDINVEFQDDHTDHIKLNDDVTVIMKYPQYNMMAGAMTGTGETNTKFIFDIIRKSVAQVVEGETIHERTDFTDKDLDEFIESLNTKQFKDIQNFFETMPKLRHVVKFKNPKTKKQNKVTLEGMQSFFE